MMFASLVLLAFVLPVPSFVERLPLPQFCERLPVPVFSERQPTPAPPMPELPKRSGRWVNQRQCVPNGCQYVPVWVPDAEEPAVVPAAPPIPAEAAAAEEKAAEPQSAGEQNWYYPRRFRWRR